MQNDNRPSFAEAKERMRRFLLEQMWSSKCVWLAENRVLRKKKQIWLFRPETDSDDQSAEILYRRILATDSSVKFIGIGQQAGRSFIVIQKYRGDPGHFYMSLSQSVPTIVTVKSSLWWRVKSFDRGLQKAF